MAIRKKLGWIGLALALVGSGAPVEAAVYNGYICTTTFNPMTGSGGDHGSFYLTVYSGAACGGSQVGSGYVCSTGATSGSCFTLYLHSEAQLLAAYQATLRALDDNVRVTVSTDTVFCGNPALCIKSITFSAAP